MESIWDFVMRRKPIFLGYFALFFVSGFASCQFLNNIISNAPVEETGTVQEIPAPNTPNASNTSNPQDALKYYEYVLSPQVVAALVVTNVTPSISLAQPDFLHVAISDSSEAASPTDILPSDNQEYDNREYNNQESESQDADGSDVAQDYTGQGISTSLDDDLKVQVAEIPHTGSDVPTERPSLKPSAAIIIKAILAALLAIASLTLAGLGLYQTYDYLRQASSSTH